MRDTDSDWQRIAESAPYFGVLADKRFLKPTEDDLLEFFQTGATDIKYVLGTIRRKFGDFAPRSALDFGCGVGRTLIPIAKCVEQAVGVDVAEGMRRLAMQNVAKSGARATVFEAIPEDMTFDWAHSAIVFQHIPPARGYPLLTKIWSQLNPGGFMTLQITIFRDRNHVTEILRDLAACSYDGERVLKYSEADSNVGQMSMYDYDLSRVISLLDLAQGQEMLLEHTNHGGCHGVRLYVQKRALTQG
jgi:2-polyprenyl-3-methyl-5-hydroxy-6-metoxy-1,4-benzoquinol methylase